MLNMNWAVIYRHFPLFLMGMRMTLVISFLSLLVSIPIGVVAGLCRVSRFRPLRAAAAAYVEFFRGVPLLVLLIWIFFVLGRVVKIGAYWSSVMGLGIFSGAFMAEIIRSGVQSVSKGQMEAARASGMTYLQAMLWVILPQAVRKVLPPIASQFIILIKDSSLVSVISIVDLSMVAKNLVATTFRSIEIWTFVAVLYFCMTYGLSQLIAYCERRFQMDH
jgi:polar amino acid transport system permease protein